MLCLRHALWLGLPTIRAHAVWQIALRRAGLTAAGELDSDQLRRLLQQWFFVLDQSLHGTSKPLPLAAMHARVAFMRIVLGLPLEALADCLQLSLLAVSRLWRDAAEALVPLAAADGNSRAQTLAWFRGLHLAQESEATPPRRSGRPILRAAMLLLLCAGIGIAACEACLQRAQQWLDGVPEEGVLAEDDAPIRRVQEQVPLSSGDFLLFADGVEYSTLERLDWLLWRQPSVRLQSGTPPMNADNASSPAFDPWQTLPAAMRSSLGAWESDWGSLASAQRAMLVQHAYRWVSLDSSQQQNALRRAKAWVDLDPLKRAQLRERFSVWQALSAAQQQQLREEQDRLAALPPEQLLTLTTAFASLTAAERRALLLLEGSDVAMVAESAFAFVPEGERDATLQMLADWPIGERELLVRVAQRLDAQGREQLRQQLLAAPPAQRIALLKAQALSVGVAP